MRLYFKTIITTLALVLFVSSIGAVKDGKTSENMETNGTPIILEMNDKEIKAELNNTVTAKEFMELLPYKVTVSRAQDDLCGSVREELASKKSEKRNSWKIGEIGWFEGWFTILVDNEKKFSHMPNINIIGKIDRSDMDTVKSFKGTVKITVRLAEEK